MRDIAGSDEPLLVAPPRPRWRIAATAAVVLLLVGLVAAVAATMLTPGGGTVPAPGVQVTPTPAAAEIYVHVLGAVIDPGLYLLPPGARTVDAIAAAGGFAEDAEPGSVNLAGAVTDGQQLRVLRIGEASPASGTPAGMTSGGLVDLNAADAATLQTLPRVGPATAERIIRWREDNGGFRSVEDLLAVTGIGAKTFAELRPLVTV